VRLGLDLLGLALVGEAGFGDLDLEVLFDPVAFERGPHFERDLGLAGKRARLHALRDRLQV
jgi:hypothetical protein